MTSVASREVTTSRARRATNVGIPMFARVSNDMVSKATAALATVRAARAVVRE
mgnify:CR=1 FL=1|jgi:hypothetical protein